jgi:hypothetical protein
MTPDRNRCNDSPNSTRVASGTRPVPGRLRLQRSYFSIIALALLSQICSPGQQSGAPQNANDVPVNHVFWIIPNFRTMSMPQPYRPVSVKEKVQIARKTRLIGAPWGSLPSLLPMAWPQTRTDHSDTARSAMCTTWPLRTRTPQSPTS